MKLRLDLQERRGERGESKERGEGGGKEGLERLNLYYSYGTGIWDYSGHLSRSFCLFNSLLTRCRFVQEDDTW